MSETLAECDITGLLKRSRNGEADALSSLFETLYSTLHTIAHQRLVRSLPNTLLDTTVLVNECYMKMASGSDLQPADRAHFLAYIAACMRSIVVDFARAKLSQRRGANAPHTSLNADIAAGVADGEQEVLVVHESIDELASVDPRVARVVEMRYFGGLSDEEIAQVLGVTDRTVRRDWEKARLLLSASLRNESAAKLA